MATPTDTNTKKPVRRMNGGGPHGTKSGISKLSSNKAVNERALDEVLQAKNDVATFNGDEGERRRSDGMGAAAVSRKHLLRLTRHACVEAALARADRTATADDAQKWLIDHGYSSDYLGNAAGSLFTDKETWEFTGQWFPSQRVSNHGHNNRVWRLK